MTQPLQLLASWHLQIVMLMRCMMHAEHSGPSAASTAAAAATRMHFYSADIDERFIIYLVSATYP